MSVRFGIIAPMKNRAKKLATLSDRLVHVLDLTGTRKADLARAIDVSPQVIQFLCSSHTKSSRFTFEIATALGLNTRWLATGEGEMFLADDPKHQLFKAYQRVPILSDNALLGFAKSKEGSLPTSRQWAVLKSTKSNLFCVKVSDTSMEPLLPINSLVFFQKVFDYHIHEGDIVLAFVEAFQTIIIRKVKQIESQTYLVPHNEALFKQIELVRPEMVIAIAIECHLKLGRD